MSPRHTVGHRLPDLIRLIRLGYRVVPLRPGLKKPAAEHLPGKKVGSLWAKPFSIDRVTVLCKQYPALGWGILPDGICVLDFDDPEAWRRSDRPIPLTPGVQTGRGYQYWFRMPDGVVLRNKNLAPGLELKAGPYIMLAGNIHHTGAVYAWLPGRSVFDVDVAPLPPWALDLYEQAQATSQNKRTTRTPVVRQVSSTVKDTSLNAPRAPAELVELLSGDDVAKAILAEQGIKYREDGKFRCILPGHKEQDPSANIWRSPTGELIYRDHHRRSNRGAYRLTDVYAALKTGELRVLGKGEQVVWGVRMLAEYGLRELPTLDLLEPVGVTDAVLKVWRGIVLLARCRLAYDRSQAQRLPLSWRFLASWCDVAENTAGKAIQEFLRSDYLRVHNSAHTKLYLFEFGPAARSRTWAGTGVRPTARHGLRLPRAFDIVVLTDGVKPVSVHRRAQPPRTSNLGGSLHHRRRGRTIPSDLQYRPILGRRMKR